MLYYLHCPTLNKVFLLLFLLFSIDVVSTLSYFLVGYFNVTSASATSSRSIALLTEVAHLGPLRSMMTRWITEWYIAKSDSLVKMDCA